MHPQLDEFPQGTQEPGRYDFYAGRSSYRWYSRIVHGAGLPLVETVTSNYVYLRLHGGELLYGSNYSEKELKEWAKKIENWKSKGKDIFIYFNNDAYGFAILNALTLKKLVQTH